MWKFLVMSVCYHLFAKVYGADPAVRIVQTHPTTFRENGYKTVAVHKDTDCLLACVVSRRPRTKKVQWMLQSTYTNTLIPISTDTDTENSYKYQIDKPANNNWRLKIRNVQQSDQGIYICRVQLNTQQNEMDTRLIQVVEIPRISDIHTSSDMDVNEDEKVELRCSAQGIPTPVISWQLVSGGVLPTGGREYTGSVILLDSVRRDHRGLYKCVALNRAGTDERQVRLTVKFQPTITAGTPVIYQAIGYNRKLTCEVSASPLPNPAQILWFKDGQVLEHEAKYTFESFRGSNYVLMKLTVHDVRETDFGRYRCYAENSEGGGENYVELRSSEVPIVQTFKKSTGTMLQISLSRNPFQLFLLAIVTFCLA